MIIDLLDKLPEISRARGNYLYSSNGRRFVDFYQEGGRAVLGYRVPGMILSMKQALDKGIFPPVNSRYGLRLKNALFSFAGNDIKYSIFTSLESLSMKTGKELPSFFPESEKGHTAFWHPFSGMEICDMLNRYSFVIPVLPFPGTFSPQILLSRTADLPESDPVSPLLLSPLIKVIYKMIELKASEPYKKWEKNTTIINKLWERKGPYLLPSYIREDHEKVFNAFLEKGFLVSPYYTVPSILPGDISEGEMSSFLRIAVILAGGI